MSISRSKSAKVLKIAQLRLLPITFFLCTLGFAGFFGAKISSYVYADELPIYVAKDSPLWNHADEESIQFVLSTTIQTNLFRPNLIHIYGEDFDYKFFSYAETVGDAIESVEFIYDGDDIFVPPYDERIVGDTWIKFIKVDNEFETVVEKLPYGSECVIDANLPVGKSKVLIAGKPGQKKYEYQNVYQDGQHVSRDLISSEVVSYPVNETIARGSKLSGSDSCVYWDTVVDSLTDNEKERYWLKSVMRCESGCTANRVSSDGNFKGLMQYNASTFFSSAVGGNYTDIFDGTQQLQQSLMRYRLGQGNSKWPVCSKRAVATTPEFCSAN